MLLKRLFGRRLDNPAPVDPQDQIASALESPEVSVRRDACRKLSDLHQLRSLADGDGDAGVRELAEARYRRLLCGLDSAAPALEARLSALERASDQALFAHAAMQASDAPLRLAAIARLDDPEVLASCATADEVAANRLAAAERVHHRAALERIVKTIGKRDKRVYRLARDRVKQLAEQEERPRRARELGEALCERLGRLGRFDNWLQDRAVLEHLEQQWREIEPDTDDSLRDRFASLRQQFIDGYEVYRQAHAAQLAEQEARARAAEQRKVLITQMQQLGERAPDLDLEAFDQEASRLSSAWQQIGPADARDDAEFELEQAYQAAEQQLIAERRRLEVGREQEQAATRLLADLRELADHGGTPDRRRLEALRKRRETLPESAQQARPEPASSADGSGSHPAPDARLSEIDQLLASLTRRLERQQKQLERKLSALPERLDELEAHLQAGELKKADPLYQSISATLEQAHSAHAGREMVAAANKRLKAIAPQLRELRHWRRWSTDEHRAMLCAEIEALAADEQHADEPSINRLQELKDQWQMLDRQGAPADEALWQRFRAAADQIRERCKPFLDAQAALRSENRKQREALATKLEDFLDKVDWERVDWKKLHRAAREMRQAWSSLLAAPGADSRGTRDRAIEGRFRRALRRLERSLAEERERNQAEKHDLIDEMRALADEPDLRRAVDAAKQLQQRWHTTVPARHRDENALWQQFRAASDAVFARRSAEYEARGATLRANQESRETICRDLLALAESGDDASSAELERRISALKTRWQDTETLPVPRQAQASLNQRWREALAAARARLAMQREGERWAGLERLARCADYCDASAHELIADTESANAGTCDALQRGWDALPAIEDPELAAAIGDRFATILAACAEPEQRRSLAARLEEGMKQREMLCLDLEIMAQVESPAPLQEARMQRQVERLRDRMTDGEADTGDDVTPLLKDWYLACPAARSSALDARFERVKAALRRETRRSQSGAEAGPALV
jgi:flagellar biosynthesis regulator FlaF